MTTRDEAGRGLGELPVSDQGDGASGAATCDVKRCGLDVILAGQGPETPQSIRHSDQAALVALRDEMLAEIARVRKYKAGPMKVSAAKRWVDTLTAYLDRQGAPDGE